MYRKLSFILLALLLLCSAALAEENRIANGDFEQQNYLGEPLGLSPLAEGSYDASNFGVCSDVAHSGTHSVFLQTDTPKYISYELTVPVEPNKAYLFEGYLRAENIINHSNDPRVGARILVEQYAKNTMDYTDTKGSWERVEVRGMTGPYQKELRIRLQLGLKNNRVTGRVFFDSLSLREIPKDEATEFFAANQVKIAANQDALSAKMARHLWYVVLSALFYLALCLVIYRCLKKNIRLVRGALWFWLLAIGIFGMKLFLAYTFHGHTADVYLLSNFAKEVFTARTSAYIQNQSGIDLPPAYMYVFFAWRQLAEIFRLPDSMDYFYLKLFPLIVDAAVGAGIFYSARGRQGDFKALLYALLYLLNPAFISINAVWGQIDMALCALMLLTLLLLWKNKEQLAIPVYALAILTKPQALLFGPIALMYAGIRWSMLAKHKEERRLFWKRLLTGIGLGILTAILILAPFSVRQPNLLWIIELYQSTMAKFPYATVNTYNLYYLLGANMQSQYGHISLYFGSLYALAFVLLGIVTELKKRKKTTMAKALSALKQSEAAPRLDAKQLLLGWLSLLYGLAVGIVLYLKPYYISFGMLNILFGFLFIFINFLYDGSAERLALWMGLCILILYVLSVRMHERYLFMGVAFLLVDFIKNHKRGSFILFVIGTLTLFYNLALLLDLNALSTQGMHSAFHPSAALCAVGNLAALALGIHHAAAHVHLREDTLPESI